MPTAVLTPFTRAAARPAGGRRWTKRLLPLGSIVYEGRQIDFSKPYLDRLAQSFSARAYDQVPLQLAGADNKHTNDVERYAGQVEGMRVDLNGEDGPGLYIDLNATERGARVLQDNPNCGVSARIVEDYGRADGKFFPAAIQHVLATLDPRVPGLGGWRAVEAANDGYVTIDLSAAEFAGEPTEGTGDMPDYGPEQNARLAKLLNLPDTAFNQLIDGLEAPALTQAELDALTGDGSGEGELSDAELDELVAIAQEMDAAGLLDEGTPQPVGAGANLSQQALLALELTNARADNTEAQLAAVTAHLDQERWLGERRHFTQDLPVPSRIVDMAQPLLLGSGRTVELSNGQVADAGQIARNMLTEFGQTLRGLGLDTGGIELGTEMDEPTQHGQAATERADVVARFKAQTGLR